MLLRAAHGYQADEFAGLVEAVFETDEAAGVDLGRQVKDRDRLKILLRARIPDDPNLDGQRAEFPFDLIEHQHRAAGPRNFPAVFRPA